VGAQRALVVSVLVGTGVVLTFAMFYPCASIADVSSHRLGPADLTVAVIATFVAILTSTRPGRQLLGRDVRGPVKQDRAGGGSRRPWAGRAPERSHRSAKVRSWSLARSARCSPSPGPPDLLALGRLAVSTEWVPRRA
jgi:hypothetical protein